MVLSLFVLDAGIRLLAERRPDLTYLSLTDWVQHKWAPEAPEARAFYQALDARIGQLMAMDITLALTADHGMSDKSDAAGEPKVIWLQDLIDEHLGPGRATVICPITDAFVAHHGALGGFVRVWLRGDLSAREVIACLAGVQGIEFALEREAACRLFELPADREADVVVVARQDTCIGGSWRDHDLSGLAGNRLRTHGGLSEAKVPFILNRPLVPGYRELAAAKPLKSHQLLDFAINGTL